jgi:hypothetical protein
VFVVPLSNIRKGVIEWYPMIWECYCAWFTAPIWVVEKIIRNIAAGECNSGNVTAEGSCIVNVGHAER